MKRILKICGIVLASLILLLLLIPLAFKGKVKDIIVSEGNKMLDAGFTVGGLDISLLRNFPNATVTLKDLELWGAGDFSGDTLLSADRISATVNLRSLFGDGGYEVTRFGINGAKAKAIVLGDGRANWDIVKRTGEEEVQDTAGGSDFRILLRKVTIDDTDIVYDDRASRMYASLEGLGFALSGDMSADHTVLRIKSAVEKAGFRYGGVPYLAGAKIAVRSDIDADFADMRFTLKDNSISVNAITAAIDGYFAIDGEAYDMDLALNTEKVGFKELLSMVPAIYAREFSDLRAAGDVELKAWVKGRMEGDLLPAFEALVNVSDGSFRYPSLPKGVDNISLSASAANPGGTADKTVVNVKPLKFTMAGNPFTATMHLSTPVSDPAFSLTAHGVLDLGMVKEVYPLEDMELNGVLNADLALDGRMSYIEKGEYDKFNASGTLRISDMAVKMSDVPDVRIDKSTLTFTPRYLQLSETTVNVGRSDVTADCRLENYIAFALKGETIKGIMNVRSDLIDLNEIMGAEIEPGERPEEESALTAPKIPENIHFDMNASIGSLLFDNLKLENVAGRVVIAGGRLDMSNLSFNTLGGGVTANGYYSTTAGVANPELNASFGLDGVSFSQAFNTFVTVQKLAPVFENLKGDFSGNIALNTRLDSMMNPLYNTMNGSGQLKTRNLNLSGVKVIDMIAGAVKQDGLKDINVRDVDVQFTIAEGRVNTKPFDLKLGDANLNLSGSTGIDQTIDYTGKISLPASTGIGKFTTVNLRIGGTFSSPSVSLDTGSMIEQAVGAVASEALKEAGEKLGIDISDAEKQREALIDQARKAGDKLVDEAQKQSDKLVEQAGGNAIKKLAAQTAGKKLVDEAKKQSDALVKKATEQGDKLVEKAKAGEE